MKKIKLLSLLLAFPLILSGCGCNRISQETYTRAVDNFNNTDALEFSRIEVITKDGEKFYERKKIDSKIVFGPNKSVIKMYYSLLVTEGSTGGSSTETNKYLQYHYVNNYLYTYLKEGGNQLDEYKEKIGAYDNAFNINTCEDNDCMLLIDKNIAPVFKIDSLENFEISKDGVAKFKSSCPSFENCDSNNELIDYVVTVDKDANIKTISYDIKKNDITYSIKYSFSAYGSNNVDIVFPGNLDTYVEKK